MGKFEEWVKQRERERVMTEEERLEIERIRRSRRRKLLKEVGCIILGWIVLVLLKIMVMR